MIDNADYERVAQYKWCALKSKNTFYAVRRQSGKFFYLHRFLTGTTDPEIDVDHKDGNGLWNTRENLRVCTHADNSKNQQTRKGTASRFKGVGRSGGVARPWLAYIKANYKFIHLGRFAEEEDAARAYDRAAQQYHGQFARLNFNDSNAPQ